MHTIRHRSRHRHRGHADRKRHISPRKREGESPERFSDHKIEQIGYACRYDQARDQPCDAEAHAFVHDHAPELLVRHADRLHHRKFPTAQDERIGDGVEHIRQCDQCQDHREEQAEHVNDRCHHLNRFTLFDVIVIRREGQIVRAFFAEECSAALCELFSQCRMIPIARIELASECRSR